MTTWSFTFVLSKPTTDDENAAELLYEAGCDDATFYVSNGIYEIDFDRVASTLEQAVTSAKANVEQSGVVTIKSIKYPDIKE